MLWRIAGHLRGLGGHLAALASNRLELFGLEWQEEITRLLGHLALLLTAVALAGCCLLFATLGNVVGGAVFVALPFVYLNRETTGPSPASAAPAVGDHTPRKA